jgi:hypothetical protein
MTAATDPFSAAYRTYLGPKYAASFKSEELWPAYSLIKHLDKTLPDAENVVMFSMGGRSSGTEVRFQLASKPGRFFYGGIDYESSFDLFDSGPTGCVCSDWLVRVSYQPLKVEVDSEEDKYFVGDGYCVRIRESVAELYTLVKD